MAARQLWLQTVVCMVCHGVGLLAAQPPAPLHLKLRNTLVCAERCAERENIISNREK